MEQSSPLPCREGIGHTHGQWVSVARQNLQDLLFHSEGRVLLHACCTDTGLPAVISTVSQVLDRVLDHRALRFYQRKSQRKTKSHTVSYIHNTQLVSVCPSVRTYCARGLVYICVGFYLIHLWEWLQLLHNWHPMPWMHPRALCWESDGCCESCSQSPL